MKTLLLLVVLVWGLRSYAEGEACTIDAEKFCSGFTAKGEEVKKCLKDHVHELSPDCKDYHAGQGKEVFKKMKKTVKKGPSGKTEQGN